MKVSGCWKKHPDAMKEYSDALKGHPDALIFQLQKRQTEMLEIDKIQFLNTPFEQNWENQVLMKQETLI